MPRFSVDALRCPIVQAPMAGGPSTPALAAAVSGAGGLGFLAAGYKTPDAVRADLEQLRGDCPLRRRSSQPVCAPGHGNGVPDVETYAATLVQEAARVGTELGEPRWDDDRYEEKLELLREQRVPVVSLTFGCPSPAHVSALHDADLAVWVTVTTSAEARTACDAGADALIVQGVEAGGHRGSFDDAAPGDIGLLALLLLVRAAVGEDMPLVAAGGIASGHGIAAVLAGGACAAAVGSAFMLCPEAGTAQAQRDALARRDTPTVLTRAFTGRTGRGIVNRFLYDHTTEAPSAYPEIHHLTAPIRATARDHGDADGFNLWAGQAASLAAAMPAADLVELLMKQTRTALAAASETLG